MRWCEQSLHRGSHLEDKRLARLRSRVRSQLRTILKDYSNRLHRYGQGALKQSSLLIAHSSDSTYDEVLTQGLNRSSLGTACGWRHQTLRMNPSKRLAVKQPLLFGCTSTALRLIQALYSRIVDG